MSRRNRKRRKLAQMARAAGSSYQRALQEQGKPTRGGGHGRLSFRTAMRFDAVRKPVQHDERHFELRLGPLRTPIHVRLSCEGDRWRAITSHTVAAPTRGALRRRTDRAVPTSAAHALIRGLRDRDTADELATGAVAAYPAASLRVAILALVVPYELARQAGHEPAESWLRPNPVYRDADESPAAPSTPFVDDVVARAPALARYRDPLVRAERLLVHEGFRAECPRTDQTTRVSWGPNGRLARIAVPAGCDAIHVLADLALAVGLARTARRALDDHARAHQARDTAEIVLRALTPNLLREHPAHLATLDLVSAGTPLASRWLIASATALAI